MSSPADILAAYLIDRGIGLEAPATPWPITVGFMPDKGNEALTTYDNGGKLEGKIQRTGKSILKPGIQVKVRSIDYEGGWDKAQDVFGLFDSTKNFQLTFNTHLWMIQAVHNTTPIMSLGQEDNTRRHRFTINAIMTLWMIS